MGSNNFRTSDPVFPKRNYAYSWVLIILIIPLFAIGIYIKDHVFSPRKILTPVGTNIEYVWPVGCKENIYEMTSPISATCKVSSYYLGSGIEFGFPQRDLGRPEYYRLGHDAVDIICPAFEKGCKIRNIVKNVYGLR